jgi:sensor domain CHASE-containing protein
MCTTLKGLQQPVTLVSIYIVTDSVQELLNLPPNTVNKSLKQCLTSYLLMVYSSIQTVINIHVYTVKPF